MNLPKVNPFIRLGKEKKRKKKEKKKKKKESIFWLKKIQNIDMECPYL